jgi:hypothetical protein
MYSTVENVRLEAGDPNPEDVTDPQIVKKILAADVIIRNSTQHDWQETDASFPLAEEISELLASSFIMDKFDDPKGEAEKNFEKGMMLLQLLITEDEGAEDVNITSPDYKTWPLNPDATISRGRLTTQNMSAQSVNPDDIYDQV